MKRVHKKLSSMMKNMQNSKTNSMNNLKLKNNIQKI